MSLATHYDARYQKRDVFGYRRIVHGPFIRAVLRKAGVRPGSTVLDVGCGQGFFSGILADCGCTVTGVDLSNVAIAQARAGVPQAKFICADTSAIEGQYDVLFVRSFSPYNSPAFGSRKEPTNGLMRLLRPGGTMIWLYNSRVNTERSTAWRWHTLDDVKDHFAGKQAQVYFSLRIECLAFGGLMLSKLPSILFCALVELCGHRFGGELVAIVKKPEAIT